MALVMVYEIEGRSVSCDMEGTTRKDKRTRDEYMRNWETVLGVIVVLVATVSAMGSTRGQMKGDTIEGWRQTAVRTDRPSSLSRDELMAIVEARTKKVKDLQVTFDTVAVKPSPGMVARSRTTIVAKGSKTYIDNYYSDDPNATTHQFRRVAAFNGKRSTICHPRDASATVESTRSRETDTQGYRFFDLNLLNAPEASRGYKKASLTRRFGDLLARGGRGRDDQSLLSLLGNSRSKVRPLLEKIGDRSCHVVDCDSLTVWLDAERGCVPLRQIFHDERNPKLTVLVFLVRKVYEVAPGFWVATRGRKFNVLTPGAALLTGTNENIILVPGWESASPAIRVNAGVPERFFDLWQSLPPGTTLWDQDSNETEIVFLGEGSVKTEGARHD